MAARQTAQWSDLRSELVSALGEAVWGMARAQDLSLEDAELVAALTWLRLADRHTTGEVPVEPGPWVLATAHAEAVRLAIVRRQQEARATIVLPRPEAVLARVRSRPPRSAETVSEPPEQAVYQAYRSLPTRARLILRLLTSDRLHYREISEILRLPPGSIGPTRSRALNAIRERLVPPVPGPSSAPPDTASPDLGELLRRALTLYDPVPDELTGNVSAWMTLPGPDAAELGLLVFDSMVDSGSTPDFGDTPGTRVLVFRDATASAVVRARPIGDRLDLIVRPVPADQRRVYLRIPGGMAVELTPAGPMSFACPFAAHGLLSLELQPEVEGEAVLLTEWVAV